MKIDKLLDNMITHHPKAFVAANAATIVATSTVITSTAAAALGKTIDWYTSNDDSNNSRTYSYAKKGAIAGGVIGVATVVSITALFLGTMIAFGRALGGRIATC